MASIPPTGPSDRESVFFPSPPINPHRIDEAAWQRIRIYERFILRSILWTIVLFPVFLVAFGYWDTLDKAPSGLAWVMAVGFLACSSKGDPSTSRVKIR